MTTPANRPTPGELADAYNAGMKAEQGISASYNLPPDLKAEWARGYSDSMTARANRECAADERLDADTECRRARERG